jgi:multiple sugar transport system substrate-binding protein
LSKEGDLDLLKITGQFPRRKNISEDAFFMDFLKENPKMKPFARQVDHIKGVDNHPHIVEVLDIISQEYESCVIYGKKEPEEAVKDAAKAVNIRLEGL